MKTPEEIKKGLRYLGARNIDDKLLLTESLVYAWQEDLACDALAYIQQLESDLSAWGDVASSPGAVEDMARENYILQHNLHEERELNEYLRDKLKQLKAERDALMHWAKGRCDTCAHSDDCVKHDPDPEGYIIHWYDDCEIWEWRGMPEPPKENGGKENDCK